MSRAISGPDGPEQRTAYEEEVSRDRAEYDDNHEYDDLDADFEREFDRDAMRTW